MGIWNDTPVEDAQIVEDKPVERVSQDIRPTEEVIKTEGLPVRCGGDRIYLLIKGQRRWIVNAEAYSKLGFKFGDEKEIDAESLALFPEGEPINV